MQPHASSNEPFADVASLLNPRSVVVVGASDRPANLGGAAVRHLRKFGYPGEILPVNPKHDTVDGVVCYPSLEELPEVSRPSLAILAVPAAATVDLITECTRAGIHYGVIWSGGFAELNSAGAELQRRLVETCRESGFVLVGPNCLGVIDTHLPLTATFSSFLLQRDEMEQGNISMVSQSGGLATMVQALAADAGFGFRYMISSGNEAVVDMSDYLHALVEDDETKVIGLYIEGVNDGDRFVRALEEARAVGKPVVVLKAGLTGATARAAAAHTGALVGEDRVWRAIFQEHAVIQVESLDEMLDVLVFLSSTDLSTLPRGPGVATVTFGGGMGVLSADGCARNGLTTPGFAEDTLVHLRALVPPIASIANPVDLTPAAYNEPWLGLLPDALEAMAADPGVHTVLAQFGTTPLDGFRMAAAVADLRGKTDKAVAIAWPFAPVGVPEFLREQGMYMFKEYFRATAVVGKIAGAAAHSDRPPRGATLQQDFDWSAFVGRPRPGTVISEHACHRMLAAAGLPVAPGRLGSTVDEVLGIAMELGFPVVLKGIASTVTHRAAAGLVELDLRSPDEVRATHARLLDRAAQIGVDLEGVYVQSMLPPGLDLLVSAFRDPVFGVIVSVGAGGVLTEVIDDVVLAQAPFDPGYALHLLRRLRLVERTGSSGRPGIEDTAQVVARFSALAASAPWERFVLEINPIRWSGEAATAVDGLLVVELP
ncbi:MAG TPA: acetate--CoA ligase family protein [Acidimicrobiia bacterium]|nr:acetate--CoA ligase family protein [Acidimicrobiia bacterium]